ncbi:Leucine-rich repeat-containing protein 14, partial [Lamprotornis superbus]
NLQAPLESLKLSLCSLIPADLAFLSQSFHAPALKKLYLSDDRFSQGLLEPLRLLLEKTSASLLYLNLRYCHIVDSDLHALLPTLLRCSRLRFLGLYKNFLSSATLKDLLQKTLELPDLHLVVYPIPVDCYRQPQQENNGDYGSDEDRERDEELFAAARAEFSEILANSGRTDLVWTDNPNNHKDLDYFSLADHEPKFYLGKARESAPSLRAAEAASGIPRGPQKPSQRHRKSSAAFFPKSRRFLPHPVVSVVSFLGPPGGAGSETNHDTQIRTAPKHALLNYLNMT